MLARVLARAFLSLYLTLSCTLQGLYELFISKMHIADPEEDPVAHARAHKGGFNIGHRPQWLALDGLGDLKHRTGAGACAPGLARAGLRALTRAPTLLDCSHHHEIGRAHV